MASDLRAFVEDGAGGSEDDEGSGERGAGAGAGGGDDDDDDDDDDVDDDDDEGEDAEGQGDGDSDADDAKETRKIGLGTNILIKSTKDIDMTALSKGELDHARSLFVMTKFDIQLDDVKDEAQKS